jgi:hypothetical protein
MSKPLYQQPELYGQPRENAATYRPRSGAGNE